MGVAYIGVSRILHCFAAEIIAEMEDIEEDPPRDDPPLSDTEELQTTAKANGPSVSFAGIGMELSEQESRIRDLLDGLSLTAGRSSTTEYKKKTLGVVQNLVNYLNPLGYFKKDQAGQDSWEIPFEDIRELSYIGRGGQGMNACIFTIELFSSLVPNLKHNNS